VVDIADILLHAKAATAFSGC